VGLDPAVEIRRFRLVRVSVRFAPGSDGCEYTHAASVCASATPVWRPRVHAKPEHDRGRAGARSCARGGRRRLSCASAGPILDLLTEQTFRYAHIPATTACSRMPKEGHAEELICSARELQRERLKSPIDCGHRPVRWRRTRWWTSDADVSGQIRTESNSAYAGTASVRLVGVWNVRVDA